MYVGSAEDETYDQVLDCIMVGPVPVGINKFVFQVWRPCRPPRRPAVLAGKLTAVCRRIRRAWTRSRWRT